MESMESRSCLKIPSNQSNLVTRNEQIQQHEHGSTEFVLVNWMDSVKWSSPKWMHSPTQFQKGKTEIENTCCTAHAVHTY